jgi:cystathionine beta-lyase/cystathionine gamma-synthase
MIFSHSSSLTLSRAASYGVDKSIVRVSVGLEDVGEIWRRFEYALEKSHVDSRSSL